MRGIYRALAGAGVVAFAFFGITSTVGAAVISVDFTGLQIEEDPGTYRVVNGSSDATILAFGVTNPTSGRAFVGIDGDTDFSGGVLAVYDDGGQIDDSNGTTNTGADNFWIAKQVTEAEWTSFVPAILRFDLLGLGTDETSTLADVFGPWIYGDVFVNWYEANDARGIAPGEIGSAFNYTGAPFSSAFVLGVDSSGIGAALVVQNLDAVSVPAPSTFALGVLAALGIAGTRKRGRSQAH